MKLISFHVDDREWERLILPFEGHALFHLPPWLRFIQSCEKVEKITLRIKKRGVVKGYFVGFIIRKGPFTILGSPLRGWSTEFMGPIMQRYSECEEFLYALEEYCKSRNIDHVELSHPQLLPEVMQHFGFEKSARITHITTLSPDEEFMWKNLKRKSCRYAIRKARTHGIVIEETDGLSISKEHHAQLVEVFARKKLVPTYSLQKIRLFCNSLQAANLLFALKACYKEKTIATGFFPHDKRYVYFWSGASLQKYNHLFPNELLHWTLMTIAAKRGIKNYDIAGDGIFKEKFGGVPILRYHWYKSYHPFAKLGRKFYAFQVRLLQKLKGASKYFQYEL